MAEERALKGGNAERGQMLLEHLGQGEAADRGRILRHAVGTLAEDHASHAAEDAGQAELGQHPVDPVLRLVRILDEQDRALEARQERRADQGRKHGEVAAEQRSQARPDRKVRMPLRWARRSSMPGGCARSASRRRRRGGGSCPRTAVPRRWRRPGRGCSGQSVRAASAICSAVMSLNPTSSFGLARISSQFRCGRIGRSPSRRGREDRLDLAIGEHRIEIAGPLLVVPAR